MFPNYSRLKQNIASLFITLMCCVTIGINPVYAEAQCIKSLPGDSFSLGSPIITQGKYLVVGDSQSNKIVVYTRDRDSEWQRQREIVPPKDSTAYKVGSGFGRTVAIDGDRLIIGAFTVIKPENTEAVNPLDFQEDNGIFSTSTVLYQTRIDRETEVKRIDLPDIPKKGVLTTKKIMAEDGKIAFVFSQHQPEKWLKRVNQIYLLSNGKTHVLPSDKLVHEVKSIVGSIDIYGIDVDLENNLLLISVDRYEDRGGVWLFDLDSPQSKPEKISLPFAKPAGVFVAISRQFMAISNTPKTSYSYLSEQSGTTLIRNIATGSTIITDGVGSLSLDKNILVRVRSVPENMEYTIGNETPRVAEIFRLDDDATPHLIQTLRDLKNAFVQDGLLITVRETTSGREVCTEQIS